MLGLPECAPASPVTDNLPLGNSNRPFPVLMAPPLASTAAVDLVLSGGWCHQCIGLAEVWTLVSCFKTNPRHRASSLQACASFLDSGGLLPSAAGAALLSPPAFSLGLGQQQASPYCRGQHPDSSGWNEFRSRSWAFPKDGWGFLNPCGGGQVSCRLVSPTGSSHSKARWAVTLGAGVCRRRHPYKI